MEADASVTSMIMYEDESVDVRYGNGAQLQLSPCGCEFMLLKSTDPRGHPLQPAERVRQRTRFTISTYKELMAAALAFRNKYASRPYLPEELISADQNEPFSSIDSGVQWPEWSSCETELGPGGETIIRSEEGRAVLTLSPSGEEFSVEFTCSLSQTQNQRRGINGRQQQARDLICDTASDHTKEVRQGGGRKTEEPTRLRSCSPRFISAQPKPEQMYQSTRVVQHRSCSAVAPIWEYPLSLARHHRTALFSKPKDVAAERTSNSSQAKARTNMSDNTSGERRSHLPQALPLSCSSPHQHRWKFKDPLAKEEHSDLPTELVNIMWCQGVTYRILSGAVSVIEVSPGDGSVIRSNGVLNSYFTHHKPELPSEQVKEVTYHLNSLPPDVIGQVYSICSIVSRASRILDCYNQAKHLLTFPATVSCLEEDKHFSKPTVFKENLSNSVPVEEHMHVTQTVYTQSDLVAAELEKIKRFNFLLENNHLLRNGKGHADLEGPSAEVSREPVNENCIAEALQRTSKTIQDIDTLISAATLT